MFIYKITNKITNKIYIGRTKNTIKSRLNGHMRDAGKGRNTVLCKSIRKHGKHNFIIEQIDICNNINELDKKEIYYIKQLNSKIPNGYNMTDGGEGVKGMTDITKEKLRQINFGKKDTLETKLLKKKNIIAALSIPSVRLKIKNKSIGLRNGNANKYIIKVDNTKIIEILGYKNVLNLYNIKYNTNILDAAYFIRKLKDGKNKHFKLLNIIKINHKENVT